MKTRGILVSLDYGQGGLWAFVIDANADEIAKRYPALSIHESPPDWMSEEELDHIADTSSLSIEDDERPIFQSALEAQQQ